MDEKQEIKSTIAIFLQHFVFEIHRNEIRCISTRIDNKRTIHRLTYFHLYCTFSISAVFMELRLICF